MRTLIALATSVALFAPAARAQSAGFLDDLKAMTYAPLAGGKALNYPTAWLPTERVAKAWVALVTEGAIRP